MDRFGDGQLIGCMILFPPHIFKLNEIKKKISRRPPTKSKAVEIFEQITFHEMKQLFKKKTVINKSKFR